jgi:hypothetical protein
VPAKVRDRIESVKELAIVPRVLRLPLARQYVGGEANLDALEAAGWVKPLIRRHKNTSYDVRQLDLAVDRANLNGWP